MMEHTLVISDLASLRMWQRRLYTTVQPRHLPAIRFQLRALSDAQNAGFSAFADSLRNACGCAGSGFLASLAIMASAVSYYASGHRLADISLRDIALFLGITILAALLGKLLGLAWARWRLVRLATRIHQTLSGTAQRSVTQSP